MKYRPSKMLARILASKLHDALPLFIEGLTDWDVVVPIPSSARQLARRGFNQCDILAQGLSVQVDSTLLVHTKDCRPQASVEYKKRASNVRNVFTSSTRAAGKSVLLIDDVITSGSTTHAAAETLLVNGALAVDVLCLAKASGNGDI